ncbi:MAG: PGF-pre-PGF domain-containing protein [Candidatus Methanoperedens sp.]
MIRRCNNLIVTLLLAFLLFGMLAGTANADFFFRGYTYNETNVTLNNTNVSIEIYLMGGQGPSLQATNYTSSNATGYFNLSINGSLDSQQYMYKPVLKHFANNATSGTLDYIGQSLPQFPKDMISNLTVSSPMNFYLRKGGMINIRARSNISNESTRVAFKYMIKDTRLGYGITENFNVEQENVNNLYVPSERNYSIMIFPNQSLPISYNLNNLSNYTDNNATIIFNTSIRPIWVNGYANLSNGASSFTNLSIITYLMEPGDIIGKDRPMPSNMSAFRNIPGGSSFSDTYYATNGSYNITLPGSAQGSGANILLFATAYSSSGDGVYYGAFKNITMSYSASDVQNFNFTLYPLLGNVENINVNNIGIQGPSNTQNITIRQLPFQLLNGTQNLTNQFAHIEIEVNYSANSSAAFKWMVDVSQTANGSFSIPAINANIRKINVFTQNFAPIKTSKNTTQLATRPVNITLTSFNNEKPDGSDITGIFMDMLLSKTECDVPNPASGCSLMPDPTTGQTEAEFNPFKVVMGGGKISLRIKQTSTRITVHYKNVDMLASGPPDALFDESASQSQSGSAIDQAWRFGSKGPEIYDEVLIGVPISLSVSSVKLGKLYDENWNSIWNITDTNAAANIPSDYSLFPSTWFGTGYTCSTTNTSSSCYIDSTNGTLWLRIPHFSGVGPTISGTTSAGGSSGSTGGGGIVTSEPYTNIEKAERYDKSLIANVPVTYTFKAPELGIYEIAVTGKENENDIAIRVEALKDTSKGVSVPAPGTVYKNLNIIVGTKKIKEAIIKFKVENSWLSSNNLAGADVKMVKWDGSKWIDRETTEKSKDGSFTYFETTTDSFSSFAITGQKAGVSPTAAATIKATPVTTEGMTATPTAAPTRKAEGFELVFAAGALCSMYLFSRKRR